MVLPVYKLFPLFWTPFFWHMLALSNCHSLKLQKMDSVRLRRSVDRSPIEGVWKWQKFRLGSRGGLPSEAARDKEAKGRAIFLLNITIFYFLPFSSSFFISSCSIVSFFSFSRRTPVLFSRPVPPFVYPYSLAL